VAREGGSIAIFPEGNRTFSGETCYINPAIGGLAKKLGLPIAFFKIEGGYGIQPRWSDVRRKGKMRAYVSHVLEPEEFKSWTNEELYQYIVKSLYQNEANSEGTFTHKNSAEYLERILYVCPHCGITHFESHGDTVECMSCHRKAKYLSNKEFSGQFPFRYVLDWYTYQQDYVNKLDPQMFTEEPIIRDTCNLYQVALYSKKQLLAENVQLALYGDRIEMTGSLTKTFLFAETENITILGKNKLDIYHGDVVYQIQSDKRFNALKYLNLYHRYKNITTEVQNGSFLGL
jgi:1-acyl-sn-glycerol-3-phosphate acyltransferase